MTIYALARFLHVVGGVGMFVALGLEWASLVQFRRAHTAEQVREWAQLGQWTRRLGGVSGLAVVVTGFYMVATVWKDGAPWISLGFGAMVLIGVVGGAAGRPMSAAVRTAIAEQGPLSPDVVARLRAPLAWISLQVRAALLLAIVFLMTSKVDLGEALGVLAAALVVSAASCVLGLRTRPVEELAR